MLDQLGRHLRGNLVAYAALLVALLGSGALALGSIPGSGGRISACFVKKGARRGQLRVLLKGRCRRKERALAWNQAGPPGPTGPAGPTGPPGPASGRAGGSLTGSYPNPGIAPNAVGPGQIADTQRAINLAVSSFTAEDTANQLDFAPTDGKADLAKVTSNVVIEWDGNTTDGAAVAANSVFTSFTVPPDYASGGELRVRLSENAATGGAEVFHCEVAINGGSFANFGSPKQVTLTTAGVTEYTLVPSATYAPGDVAGIQCDAEPINHNDDIRLHGAEFVYNAVQ